ncbi:hypothetical protein EDM53_00925 [Rickettsiales endosymbiont of Peranema trichophorum]|uniref:hypothetical protein n=1 Tax=Rickettsiales endosymbiont of Peranema trichophorum TaxID=2486577 RepID=UPI0010233F02|nr:hypothetical protein [Rickettsiales endosymbiont of Peranema trichophorum]RZI47629.1 hypothetical protein EDM53_00925 [Rickettsiales endosymbiont of Peranema trichophorum]
MTNTLVQEIVELINHVTDSHELGNLIGDKLKLLSAEDVVALFRNRTGDGLSILGAATNKSPEALYSIFSSSPVVNLGEEYIHELMHIKDKHGYTVLEQVMRISPNHIRAVLNSESFLKLSEGYKVASLTKKNDYGISVMEYALRHESSAFIKAVLCSTSVRSMSEDGLLRLLSARDGDDVELFISAAGLSIEHLRAVVNRETLGRLSIDALDVLLLKDCLDGNSLLSLIALRKPLAELNLILDRYSEFGLGKEKILGLLTDKNDDGKKLVEIAVYKGPDYISSLLNHDIIFRQLDSVQQVEVLTTYNEGGEPLLIAAFNKSPQHVKAVISSDTFLNLSGKEVLEVLGAKSEVGDTFLEVLHSKGSEDYVRVLQDSEVFYGLNHELQMQILEQVGMYYDEMN